MWIVAARKQGNVVEMIGPFDTAQAAARWVHDHYTEKLGITTTIEKLTSPEQASKKDGK